MNQIKKRSPVEIKVWKIIKVAQMQNKKFLIALSGGLDSVALLLIFKSLFKAQQIVAFYFHHGDGKQSRYRNQALKFCKDLCAKLNISFLSEKSESLLNNENDFRKARYQSLRKIKVQENCDFIVTAHHQDDLLETRLIRLLRGTGLRGLEAIKIKDQDLFRPLLHFEKLELEKYLKSEKMKWLEDPSNSKDVYFRNWVRKHIILSLRKKDPSLLLNLSRSLENIIQEGKVENLLKESLKFCEVGVSRLYYLGLDPRQKMQILSQYILSLNKPQLRHSQIQEIVKRLDNSQNVLKFRVGGLDWYVYPDHFEVR